MVIKKLVTVNTVHMNMDGSRFKVQG